MGYEFELLSPTDKPALLGISSIECQAQVLAALDSLGYKVHPAQSMDDFINRFTQIPYQVAIIEELFDCTSARDNRALAFIQNLPMALRRHATIILIGDHFQTLHPLQAFQQSVHAVVNSNDLASLFNIIPKVVSDNDLFLTAYRQMQERAAKGKE